MTYIGLVAVFSVLVILTFSSRTKILVPERKTRSYDVFEYPASSSRRWLAGVQRPLLRRRYQTSSGPQELESCLDSVRKLSVLCSAGVDLARAIQVLASTTIQTNETPANNGSSSANKSTTGGRCQHLWRKLDQLVRGGIPVHVAAHRVVEDLHRDGAPVFLQQFWNMLACSAHVATSQGTSTAVLLQNISDELALDIYQLRSRQVAMAGPATTAGVLLMMPIAAMFLGKSLGVNTAYFLTSTALGWLCLGLSAVSIVLGLVVFHFLARKFKVRMLGLGGDPGQAWLGVAYEVLASGALGGSSDDTSMRTLVQVFEASDQTLCAEVLVDLRHLLRGREYGLSWSECRYGLRREDVMELCDVLSLCSATGAPISTMLREHLSARRAHERHETERRSELLATLLAVPVTLGLLPVFFFVGLVPIALDLLLHSNM